MNIEELYQEVILDHSKRPRNFGPLPNATATVKGDNPSCGDEVELAVKAHARDDRGSQVPGSRLRNLHGVRLDHDGQNARQVSGRSAGDRRGIPAHAYHPGAGRPACKLWRLAGLRCGSQVSPACEVRDSRLASPGTGPFSVARARSNHRGYGIGALSLNLAARVEKSGVQSSRLLSPGRAGEQHASPEHSAQPPILKLLLSVYSIFSRPGPLGRLPSGQSGRDKASSSHSLVRSNGRISRFSARLRVRRRFPV